MITRPPNLDQLNVFLAIVAEGSFSAAARKLKRAQSAVTYAIQELEADLKITLFDRANYRPELTESGRALLPRARRVLREADALRLQAEAMGGGLEPEVGLVVDAMYPMTKLVKPLRVFQTQFPSVTTRLNVEGLGAAAAMVANGRADLGLVISHFAKSDQFESRPAGVVSLAAVASPGHPLAELQRATRKPLSSDEVVDQLQLVLSESVERNGGERDYGVTAINTWRIADLGAKRAMLKAGLGWGSLPRHLIVEDVRAGRLVELRLEKWAGDERLPELDMCLIRRANTPLGPAGQWLFEHLPTAFGPRSTRSSTVAPLRS